MLLYRTSYLVSKVSLCRRTFETSVETSFVFLRTGKIPKHLSLLHFYVDSVGTRRGVPRKVVVKEKSSFSSSLKKIRKKTFETEV